MDGKIKVKFIKAMYPYDKGDEGFVSPMIAKQYPDHVQPIDTKEVVKTKKEQPVADKAEADTKEVEQPVADKAMKKKSSK